MQSNYAKIVQDNLQTLFSLERDRRANAMGAQVEGDQFRLNAFGAHCTIEPHAIVLGGREQTGPLGIILSLYALHATDLPLEVEPLKAFKEFPNSMPYVGAFASHTEQILTQSVHRIIRYRDRIMRAMSGGEAPSAVSGDSTMLVQPLPKIALCYIFYEADDDFPATATCLFSSNADRHMPMDGLADVGEYTSRAILELINEE